VRYVLIATSDGRDLHSRLAFLAASMIRRHHTSATITLLTDPTTRDCISRHQPGILSLIDDLVPLDAPFDDAVSINRYLRMTAREMLRGDFVYVDNDAWVMQPIDELETAPEDVAGVPNVDYLRPEPHTPDELRSRFQQLGWPFPCRYYLNCGVLRLRDTPAVRELCRDWMERWTRYRALYSAHDQPAFNAALSASSASVRILPFRFNAQVEAVSSHARDAAVFHFYASQTFRRSNLSTLLEYVEWRLRETGTIDWAIVDECRRTGYPWIGRHSPRRLWAHRRYARAVLQVAQDVAYRIRYGDGPSPGFPVDGER
jgi:hypothetical protein